MSSQPRPRNSWEAKMRFEHKYQAWLFRRPPWWKFWAVKRWKGEEPK